MEPLSISRQERADLLKGLEWVGDLTAEQIEHVTRFMLVFAVKKDALVFREGDDAAFLGIIVSGRVRVHKEDKTATPRKIAILERGNTFGEMSLIDGQPRSASIYADEDCTIFVLTEANFFSLLEEHPSIGIKIIFSTALSMSRRLRQTTQWLLEALDYSEVRERGDD